MIVFRLGKMIGAKGPGAVLVFPWLDRYQVRTVIKSIICGFDLKKDKTNIKLKQQIVDDPLHCIDHQTVDVGDAAFSVPPQQLITHDGGIIEIGAEVQMVMDMIIIDFDHDHEDDKDDGRMLTNTFSRCSMLSLMWW